MMTRRRAIRNTALAGATLAMSPHAIARAKSTANAAVKADGAFTLPPLPYAYDALEPYIDARTMEIHHDKHHAAYVANLNKALAGYPDLEKMPVEDLLRNLNAVPEKVRTAVRNNGGGHFNHSLFWQILKKDGGEPKGALARAIDSAFGSFAAFHDQLSKAAVGQFGSGWAWLVIDANKQLNIEGSANQDSPISQGRLPLLGVDVWEHAYYLKYQNRRAEYVHNWWNTVNWPRVAQRFAAASQPDSSPVSSGTSAWASPRRRRRHVALTCHDDAACDGFVGGDSARKL
jgi:Fe-Mn family superoxide dismutase